MNDFDIGFLIGILVGEGHFGGDKRQPQITIRMHIGHEALFYWLQEKLPGGKMYGPYHHNDRHYYQFMIRNRYLKEVLVPILDKHLTPDLSNHIYARYQAMKERYPTRMKSG